MTGTTGDTMPKCPACGNTTGHKDGCRKVMFDAMRQEQAK